MNVAVIFGGESCEHDISIITGEQLINACDEFLYKILGDCKINRKND